MHWINKLFMYSCVSLLAMTQDEPLHLCASGTVQLALSAVLSFPHVVKCISPESLVKGDRLTSAQVVAFRDSPSCAAYHERMMETLQRIYPACVDSTSMVSTTKMGATTFAQRVKSLTS
ncbi:hypothetical protein DYB35_005391 [Aphanomyces astaci]|uniref:Secreted protein n=1 Tax=Aphanomyces astaci TaxID=112090 RepID=A0A418DLB6_APHAT|nr:hypothetical protein DYB35_005391 [Aphanomyces astaci]